MENNGKLESQDGERTRSIHLRGEPSPQDIKDAFLRALKSDADNFDLNVGSNEKISSTQISRDDLQDIVDSGQLDEYVSTISDAMGRGDTDLAAMPHDVAITANNMINDLTAKYAEFQDIIDSGKPIPPEIQEKMQEFIDDFIHKAEKLAKMSSDKDADWWVKHLGNNVGSPPGVKGGIEHLLARLHDAKRQNSDNEMMASENDKFKEPNYIAPGSFPQNMDAGNLKIVALIDQNQIQIDTEISPSLSDKVNDVFNLETAQEKIDREMQIAALVGRQNENNIPGAYEPSTSITQSAAKV